MDKIYILNPTATDAYNDILKRYTEKNENVDYVKDGDSIMEINYIYSYKDHTLYQIYLKKDDIKYYFIITEKDHVSTIVFDYNHTKYFKNIRYSEMLELTQQYIEANIEEIKSNTFSYMNMDIKEIKYITIDKLPNSNNWEYMADIKNDDKEYENIINNIFLSNTIIKNPNGIISKDRSMYMDPLYNISFFRDIFRYRVEYKKLIDELIKTYKKIFCPISTVYEKEILKNFLNRKGLILTNISLEDFIQFNKHDKNIHYKKEGHYYIIFYKHKTMNTKNNSLEQLYDEIKNQYSTRIIQMYFEKYECPTKNGKTINKMVTGIKFFVKNTTVYIDGKLYPIIEKIQELNQEMNRQNIFFTNMENYGDFFKDDIYNIILQEINKTFHIYKITINDIKYTFFNNKPYIIFIINQNENNQIKYVIHSNGGEIPFDIKEKVKNNKYSDEINVITYRPKLIKPNNRWKYIYELNNKDIGFVLESVDPQNLKSYFNHEFSSESIVDNDLSISFDTKKCIHILKEQNLDDLKNKINEILNIYKETTIILYVYEDFIKKNFKVELINKTYSYYYTITKK